MNAARLWFGLAQLRYGVLHWIAAGMLAMGGLLHGVVLPRLEAQVLVEQAATRSGDAAPRQPASEPEDSVRWMVLKQRYDAFFAVVPDEDQTSRVVEAVFASAARNGLVLAQADYKRGTDREGGLTTLEMRLPVKGRYPDLRRFVDDTLGAMPGVALKEATFRRDVIDAETVEAQLRFVLFFRDARR